MSVYCTNMFIIISKSILHIHIVIFLYIAGFSRPIYLFKKGNDVKSQQRKPKHVFYDSNSSFDDSDVEQLSEWLAYNI